MTDILTPPDDPKERKRFWKKLKRQAKKEGFLLMGDGAAEPPAGPERRAIAPKPR